MVSGVENTFFLVILIGRNRQFVIFAENRHFSTNGVYPRQQEGGMDAGCGCWARAVMVKGQAQSDDTASTVQTCACGH